LTIADMSESFASTESKSAQLAEVLSVSWEKKVLGCGC